MRRPFLPIARNAATLWLVLALFALKALVPQGFMPAAQQGTLIQLCSAAGTIWVAGPAKHSDAPDERHAAQAAACPMGAMLAAVARPPPVAEGFLPGPPLGARAPPAFSVLS